MKKVVVEKVLFKEFLEMYFSKSFNILDVNFLFMDLELGFYGYYGELIMLFSDFIICFGKILFCLEYDLIIG